MPKPSSDNHIASDLLERVRGGDRQAAAEFAMRYAPLLRRRIAGKLGPQLRRHFDSMDILSTVLRRLDVFVDDRRLAATTEEEFWALMLRIAQNAMVDKARTLRRLDAERGEDDVVARSLARRLRLSAKHGEDAMDVELASALDALDDDDDRRILWLWLNGLTHPQIAEALSISHDATRKRWERIRRRIREACEDPDSR
ncbi:MAG: hypothetical protein IBJ10_01520 [Phycisphaerales bacterium]|nr:hypothetical protein [Phycisphaerales bacterium]